MTAHRSMTSRALAVGVSVAAVLATSAVAVLPGMSATNATARVGKLKPHQELATARVGQKSRHILATARVGKVRR